MTHNDKLRTYHDHTYLTFRGSENTAGYFCQPTDHCVQSVAMCIICTSFIHTTNTSDAPIRDFTDVPIINTFLLADTDNRSDNKII